MKFFPIASMFTSLVCALLTVFLLIVVGSCLKNHLTDVVFLLEGVLGILILAACHQFFQAGLKGLERLLLMVKQEQLDKDRAICFAPTWNCSKKEEAKK